MKKIAILNVKNMHTEEAFGFFKLVKEETALLTDETVKPTVDAFAAAYEAFDDALKDAAVTPAGTLTSQCDARRDFAYRGLAGVVRTHAQYHPDLDIRAKAQEAKGILDKYGDPTALAQTKESGVLHNLLQDLTALGEEELSKTELKVYLNELVEAEEAFLAAVKQRTDEEAQRVTGIVQQTRTACEAAYRQLVDVVNALSMLNPTNEGYNTFAEHLNVLVERQKTVLKARATTNAKKSAPKE